VKIRDGGKFVYNTKMGNIYEVRIIYEMAVEKRNTTKRSLLAKVMG
jgi:hypothetical protein